MKELFLIYVNMVGKDYKGNLIYEFIFSDTTKNIEFVAAVKLLLPNYSRPSHWRLICILTKMANTNSMLPN